MYVPKHFDEPRVEVLHQLMRARPLATLVTYAAGSLDANHIPLHFSTAPAPLGSLQGHVARANPVWRQAEQGAEVLAIFHGPEAYITPSWYPTKAEGGKAVPTWNYAVVHAHGTLRIIDDTAWLRASLEALTAEHEAAFAEPWRMSDAPADYIENMLAAVVGIEIAITRLEGKWKASQNQPAQNRAGVAAGLRAGGAEAQAMADLVAAAK